MLHMKRLLKKSLIPGKFEKNQHKKKKRNKFEKNLRKSHLAIHTAFKKQVLTIEATITSILPVDKVQLFYKRKGNCDYRIIDMHKKEDFIYSTKIPAIESGSDEMKYFIKAKDVEGNTSCLPEKKGKNPFCLRFLSDKYVVPRIIEHKRIFSHKLNKPLSLKVRVNNSSSILDIKMHYRKVNQNEEFKTVSIKKGRGGEYIGIIPAGELDSLYDMMYYFEVLGGAGDGTFYPDPFWQGRYFIVKMLE